jgi:hypothetical protein
LRNVHLVVFLLLSFSFGFIKKEIILHIFWVWRYGEIGSRMGVAWSVGNTIITCV